MERNSNKRQLSVDDELERAYADLKASIQKAVSQTAKFRRPTRNIEMPPVYKVVSRGDDDWRK